LCSSLKKDIEVITRLYSIVRLFRPWAKALTELLLMLFEWLDWWQLDSKTVNVPSLSPGRGTLTNK